MEAEEYKIPCDCCSICHQDIPCGGVMAGGPCDQLCDCDEWGMFENQDEAHDRFESACADMFKRKR